MKNSKVNQAKVNRDATILIVSILLTALAVVTYFLMNSYVVNI